MVVAALSAGVGPANADTFVGTSTGKSSVVDAGGSALGADGCTVTEWSINAGKNLDGSSQTIYTGTGNNFCFGERVHKTGVTTDGVVDFDPSGLQSAHVQGTIPLTFFPGGSSAVDGVDAVDLLCEGHQFELRGVNSYPAWFVYHQAWLLC